MSDFLLQIIKGLISKLIIDEAGLAAGSISGWMVSQAAKKLPGVDRDRYGEQWLADLNDRRTPVRKLIFAIGIWRGALVMRHEVLYPNVKMLDRVLIRCMDVGFAAFALLSFLPFFLPIVVAIYASQGFRGPLFCNTFPRKDGRMVYREGVLAFRTHDKSGEITEVGKLLRRYGFDSLPRLYLLLVGKCSLVGRRGMVFERSDGGIEDQYLESSTMEEEEADPKVATYLSRPPGIIWPGFLGESDQEVVDGNISARAYLRCFIRAFRSAVRNQ